mmetsp:Transcript_11577/g.40523  ORF Transcript_11577/g.40523 Transcript_11577/m.40523 type:complete len:515 (+) Transcript_11577:1585-3129(+)
MSTSADVERRARLLSGGAPPAPPPAPPTPARSARSASSAPGAVSMDPRPTPRCTDTTASMASATATSGALSRSSATCSNNDRRITNTCRSARARAAPSGAAPFAARCSSSSTDAAERSCRPSGPHAGGPSAPPRAAGWPTSKTRSSDHARGYVAARAACAATHATESLTLAATASNLRLAHIARSTPTTHGPTASVCGHRSMREAHTTMNRSWNLRADCARNWHAPRIMSGGSSARRKASDAEDEPLSGSQMMAKRVRSEASMRSCDAACGCGIATGDGASGGTIHTARSSCSTSCASGDGVGAATPSASSATATVGSGEDRASSCTHSCAISSSLAGQSAGAATSSCATAGTTGPTARLMRSLPIGAIAADSSATMTSLLAPCDARTPIARRAMCSRAASASASSAVGPIRMPHTAVQNSDDPNSAAASAGAASAATCIANSSTDVDGVAAASPVVESASNETAARTTARAPPSRASAPRVRCRTACCFAPSGSWCESATARRSFSMSTTAPP